MTYIWRDKNDPNQFWIGVRARYGKYCGWISIFCDGIEECFGKDAWLAVKDLTPGGEPVRVLLLMQVDGSAK